MNFIPKESGHYLTIKNDRAEYIEGGMREARKLDAWPSITTVLKVLGKPALINWLQGEAMKATYELGAELAQSGIDPFKDDSWLSGVQERAERVSREAAEKGNALHSIAEAYILGELVSMPTLSETVYQLYNWIDDNVKVQSCKTEELLHSDFHQMGGRCDLSGYLLDGRPFVLDFKSQNVKGKKPNFYPEWPMQLAFYDYCIGDRGNGVIISMVLSTNVDNQGIWIKEYTEEEKTSALEAVWHTRQLYKYLNKL